MTEVVVRVVHVAFAIVVAAGFVAIWRAVQSLDFVTV